MHVCQQLGHEPPPVHIIDPGACGAHLFIGLLSKYWTLGIPLSINMFFVYILMEVGLTCKHFPAGTAKGS